MSKILERHLDLPFVSNFRRRGYRIVSGITWASIHFPSRALTCNPPTSSKFNPVISNNTLKQERHSAIITMCARSNRRPLTPLTLRRRRIQQKPQNIILTLMQRQEIILRKLPSTYHRRRAKIHSSPGQNGLTNDLAGPCKTSGNAILDPICLER